MYRYKYKRERSRTPGADNRLLRRKKIDDAGERSCNAVSGFLERCRWMIIMRSSGEPFDNPIGYWISGARSKLIAFGAIVYMYNIFIGFS